MEDFLLFPSYLGKQWRAFAACLILLLDVSITVLLSSPFSSKKEVYESL